MTKMIFKDKNCTICGNTYTPTGRCSKFCSICIVKHKKEKAAIDQMAYRIRKGITKNPGIGSGGSQLKGKDSPYYKNGIGSDFSAIRKKIKTERRYCEKCSKDLKDASHYQWCTHHIDHDRTNNTESNFMLLCKRCHQIEHECHKSFGTCND